MNKSESFITNFLKLILIVVLPHIMISLNFFGFRVLNFFVEFTPHVFFHLERECSLCNQKTGWSTLGSITRQTEQMEPQISGNHLHTFRSALQSVTFVYVRFVERNCMEYGFFKNQSQWQLHTAQHEVFYRGLFLVEYWRPLSVAVYQTTYSFYSFVLQVLPSDYCAIRTVLCKDVMLTLFILTFPPPPRTPTLLRIMFVIHKVFGMYWTYHTIATAKRKYQRESCCI